MGVDNPGALGLVILAAVAGGANPSHFGGQANSDDLVARLQATEQLHGASAGVFGATKAENAFNQSLALLALDSVKDSGKATSLSEAYLARLQCTDGGWEYVRATLSTPCAQGGPEDPFRSRHELDGSCRHGNRRGRRPLRPWPVGFLQ